MKESLPRIEHAPAVHEFPQAQVSSFLDGVAAGLPDDVCMLKAGIPLSLASDLKIRVTEAEYAEARARAKLPLAEVRVRMNAIMEAANDPDYPMPLSDALDILGRRDPEWSSKQKVEHSAAPERVDPEEEKRLQGVFGLPEASVIEGEFVPKK